MKSPRLPAPAPQAVRRERTPDTGVVHFITLTTKDREPWLATSRTRDVFLAVLRAWHSERNGRILAATVLPDHAHVLVRLGEGMKTFQVLNGWKSAIRRGAGYAETFQEKFSDHPLKADEDPEDYGLYMFLHPYRGKHCNAEQSWPGWWSPEPGFFQFMGSLNSKGGPPQEWIDWPASKFAKLGHGE